jgi:uncharacterized RDD family membrane protein YckC
LRFFAPHATTPARHNRATRATTRPPMQWYYASNNASNNTRHGPVSQEEFDQLAASGAIAPDTLVWRAGMDAWLPWEQARAALPAPDADSAICALSGKIFPKSDMLHYNGQWISAARKDEFFQRLREGVPSGDEMRYAGFWIRFVAAFIDAVILGIVGIPFQLLLGFGLVGVAAHHQQQPEIIASARLLLMLISTIIGLGYEIFFIRRYNATPGKLALGLKLVRADGTKLSIGRIIGRHFAKLVSALLFCIGYLIAAWDSEKRALHDHLCDTRVIKT